MKILFDHEVFSYQPVGGIARYYAELISELERLEPGSCLAGFRFTNTEYLYRKGLDRKFSLCRYPFPESRISKPFFFRLNRICFERALKYGKPDVVHLTYYPRPEWSRRISRPVAITVHDMIPELYPQYFAGGGKWMEAKRFWCGRADRIFTVSEQTRKDLLRLFPEVAPEKVFSIYNSGTVAEEQKMLPCPKPYLLYVGRRDGYKHFLFALQALAPLFQQERRLFLVCAGGGAFSTEERDAIRRNGMQDRTVQYSCTDAELSYLYRNGELLLYPSQYEGFGIPVTEAFSAGLPVVLSRSSCFPEIAGDAALFFDPDDAESLRAAVRRLLGEPELRKELCARGTERLKRFSWETSARRILAHYRSMIRS